MRLKNSFYKTFKEIPKDAQIPSHQLMFRTGMIQQLASGIYNYMPLALRSIQKIEKIIREELNSRSCEEVLMPAVLPADLWKKTGRWNLYGDLLLRFRDRKNKEYCMGPTHEEVITDMVKRNLRSWKQLPWNLYQIQTKFRDEFRPRFGLMRGREFIMKDAYSFDVDAKGAKKSYEQMYEAYNAIFTRCGVKFRAVDAATGEIGGNMSHEFQVLAESGEDIILCCNECDYAANIDKAFSPARRPEIDENNHKPMTPIFTPDIKTMDEVSKYLKTDKSKFLKSLVYTTDESLILILIAGHKDINEVKLQALTGSSQLTLAKNDKVKEIMGVEPGFVGPVGVPENLKLIADYSVYDSDNWITGANIADKHLLNVNLNRDFSVDEVADISFATAGEKCPLCASGRLEEYRGIEVGQVFYLGTKYAKALECCYLDEKGQSRPAEMGCYGIGVGRTMAAAIEQNHDADGIIWPVPLAPWEVVVLPLQTSEPKVLCEAEKIYDELNSLGIEVVLDDRPERGGFKFKDADLIGYPVQIAIGKRSVESGLAEIKYRASGEKVELALNSAAKSVADWIKQNR